MRMTDTSPGPAGGDGRGNRPADSPDRCPILGHEETYDSNLSRFILVRSAPLRFRGCGASVDQSLVDQAGKHGNALEAVYALYNQDVLKIAPNRDLKDVNAALKANDPKKATEGDLRRAAGGDRQLASTSSTTTRTSSALQTRSCAPRRLRTSPARSTSPATARSSPPTTRRPLRSPRTRAPPPSARCATRPRPSRSTSISSRPGRATSTTARPPRFISTADASDKAYAKLQSADQDRRGQGQPDQAARSARRRDG